MRAREFISEAKGPQGTRTDPAKEFERAHPGMVMPGGRGDVYWGRYYDFYRVASLAGMDPKDIDAVDEVEHLHDLIKDEVFTERERQAFYALAADPYATFAEVGAKLVPPAPRGGAYMIIQSLKRKMEKLCLPSLSR